MSITRRPHVTALFLALVIFAAPLTILPAQASPADSYSGTHFGAGNLPSGCIADMSKPAPENSCYHMRTDLNGLDSPKVDVLVMVPASPAAERDMRMMRQSVEMWEGGIDYLAKEMGLDWLADGMDFRVTVDHFDPLGEGGEFTTYPIVDPEIVVIAANPIGVAKAGIGIDPVDFVFTNEDQVPCHNVENPFDFQYWENLPGFDTHHESRSGTYVEDCDGKGGNICFAINAATDPEPSSVDFGTGLFDLVSHEFGHCLTVGHVGDGLEGAWGAVPTNDIMAYNPDPVGITKCVSTLDVEGVALRMSRYLDVNGDGAVNAQDRLVANDPIGVGDPNGAGSNPFQVQHPNDHLYASSSGDPYDCPQPDVGLVRGERVDWTPEPAGEPDGDEDGIPDATDNCRDLANPGQEDSDGDGAGDACESGPRTLYMDGTSPIGEVDQPPGGGYLQLNVDPGSEEKSMMIPNYVGGPNPLCAGNSLFPVFVGDLAGRVVGDMEVTFPAIASGESVDIRVWPDVTAQMCNATYPAPAGSVEVALPTGKGTVQATIPDLDFVADSSVMIQITPVLASGPGYARALYGTPASSATFCLVPTGASADGCGVSELDSDGDGTPDSSDNCPDVANPGQEDSDADGIGDACDSNVVDTDGDGVADDSDNCPEVANPGQVDADSDGNGDACDSDRDGDGTANDTDNCPSNANPDQADEDKDGIGDVCDGSRSAPTTTYFWHGTSRSNQPDQITGGATFNTTAPTSTTSAVSVDVPIVRGTPWDSHWTGPMNSTTGAIERLGFDFWYRSPSLSPGSYDVSLAAGPPYVNTLVGTIAVPVTGHDAEHVSVALDLATPFVVPEGKQLRLTLHSVNASAPQSIMYDSIAHPSGFTVNPEPEGETGECDGVETATKVAGQRGEYSSAPNDPCFDKQWGMGIVGAPDAWAAGATGHQIRVAVIDSGLDLGHPDFDCPDKIDLDKAAAVIDGKVLRGAKAEDIDGHGTHVAGIVGACTNNGTGVVGVAPDATIIPYRVFTTAEEGAGQLNDIAVAIEQATDDGAHVINMSLGIGIGAAPLVGGAIGYIPDEFPEIDQAIEYAQSQGVVVVIAAGNSFVLPLCEYPAIAEDAICVGATDRNDLKSSFGTFPNKPSSDDPTADRPMGPSISAPGGIGNIIPLAQLCPESIFSTYRRETGSFCSTPGYDAIDGTSMASPHVAGAAALLYDRLSGARSDENRQLIVDRLLDTSKDLGTPGYDPLYGYGRLDVSAAVDGFGSTGPTTVPTSLALTTDTPASGQYSDDVVIGARLLDDTEKPVEGKSVTFDLVGDSGTTTWTATTNAEGVASSTRTLTQEPGRYQLIVTFAPDEVHEGSTDVGDFTIDLEGSTASLDVGPASGAGKTRSRVLKATIADHDSGVGVSGATVSFYCDGALITSVQAGDDGVARTSSPKNCSNGSHEYQAIFDGDARYVGSRATHVT